jgi:DNA processing protein
MASVPNLPDLVALSLLPSWTWRLAAERLRAGSAVRRVFEELIASRVNGQTSASTLRERAATAIACAGERGIAAIPWSAAAYPAALATIVDPPFVLWTRGVADALERPAVAMVGSRTASPYGLAVAEQLAADLAARGIVVVSGLAREIESTGLVLSELVPGTPPLPWFFPMRNRIISGLARAVVVIEAGEKSGSLITARLALDQGRDVLAVPGNVLSGRNRGAHALLRDGAKIVEGADDILDELGMTETALGSRFVDAGGTKRPPIARSEDPVLASLVAGEPADLDAIAERTGVPAARLLPRLFELELKGLVARAGGGRFVRN